MVAFQKVVLQSRKGQEGLLCKGASVAWKKRRTNGLRNTSPLRVLAHQGKNLFIHPSRKEAIGVLGEGKTAVSGDGKSHLAGYLIFRGNLGGKNRGGRTRLFGEALSDCKKNQGAPERRGYVGERKGILARRLVVP